jgi:hypothetical protein
MATDSTSIVVLTSTASEVEAAAIAGALAEHGIMARVVGGYTAGFRAESPGRCQILVTENELGRAQEVLDALRAEGPATDWSAVDVGDEQAMLDDGEGAAAPEDAEPRHDAKYQVSLRTLLVIQTVVCVAAGLLVGPRGAVVSTILLVSALQILIVASTVHIASNANRARQWLRYGVLSMVAAYAAALLLQLGRMLL